MFFEGDRAIFEERKNIKIMKKVFFSAIKNLKMEEFSETVSLARSITHSILKSIIMYRKYKKCKKVIDKDLVSVGSMKKMS